MDLEGLLRAASPALVRRFALDVVDAEALAAGVPLHLVGGVVRDVLLGRPVAEVDLAGPGDLLGLARRIARRVRGALVPLDTEMGIVRVVIGAGEGDARWIDLARWRAEDLASDLALRDFRLNALAWPLAAVVGREPAGPLIDPTGGAADLTRRVIEVTGEGVFQDDPLRMLRAYRIAARLEFSVGARARALAAAQAPLLGRVAAERITEEMVKTLGVARPAEAMRGMDEAGLVSCVFPEIASSSRGVGLLEATAQELQAAAAERIERYLAAPAAYGATHREVVLLAAFLVGGGWPRPQGRRRREGDFGRLRLSSRDGEALSRLLGAFDALGSSGWSGPPGALAAHRFFRDHAPEGPGALLIHRARTRLDPSRAPGLEVASALLNTFACEHDTVVEPPRLVDGSLLQTELSIAPGPRVRELLMRVREAQAEGRVRTRDEAIEFLRALESARAPAGRP